MDQDEMIHRLLQESRPVSMPKAELVAQMIKQIRSIGLTSDEVLGLYTAITGRMKWKTCAICLKAKLEIEGKMIFLNGDLSRPKRFVCKDC